MKRKRIAWICTGLLAFAAVFLVGLSVHQSTSNEGTLSEWWSDLGQVRSVKDLTAVLSGERARQRRMWRPIELAQVEIELREITLLNIGQRVMSDSPTFG